MRNIEFNSNLRKAKVKFKSKMGQNVDYVVFLKKTNINIFAYLVDINTNLTLFSLNSSELKDEKLNGINKSKATSSFFAKEILKRFPDFCNARFIKDSDEKKNKKYLVISNSGYRYIGRVKAFIDEFNNILK